MFIDSAHVNVVRYTFSTFSSAILLAFSASRCSFCCFVVKANRNVLQHRLIDEMENSLLTLDFVADLECSI